MSRNSHSCTNMVYLVCYLIQCGSRDVVQALSLYFYPRKSVEMEEATGDLMGQVGRKDALPSYLY